MRRQSVLGGEFGENGRVDGIEWGSFWEKKRWFGELVRYLFVPIPNQGSFRRKGVATGGWLSVSETYLHSQNPSKKIRSKTKQIESKKNKMKVSIQYIERCEWQVQEEYEENGCEQWRCAHCFHVWESERERSGRREAGNINKERKNHPLWVCVENTISFLFYKDFALQSWLFVSSLVLWIGQKDSQNQRRSHHLTIPSTWLLFLLYSALNLFIFSTHSGSCVLK